MQSNASSSGVSFIGLLGILFVALKLTGHIDWSWIWVLCPFWAGIAVFLAVLILFAISAGVVLIIAAFNEWRK